jgi:hypothetical protein
VLCLCLFNLNCSQKTSTPSKINGVSLVSTSEKVTSENLSSLKKINPNWIALIPYAFCRAGEPEVYYDSKKQWRGERPEGIKHAAKLAKKQGFKLMLKPQIWVGGEGWTGDFTLKSKADWQTWQNGYHNYILQLAKLAEAEEIELFCIGTELKIIATERPVFWQGLIKDVEKVYHGKLTYAANWDNYQNINFWKSLDYIGIDAYFPLSQSKKPSVEELKLAWEKTATVLKKISQQKEKPILFTEYGYRNIDKAAGNQWELPSSRHYRGELNNDVQSNAYRAFYETFWTKKWVAGGFLWKWFPKHGQMKSKKNSGYSPQHKPVENVISEYYRNQP